MSSLEPFTSNTSYTYNAFDAVGLWPHVKLPLPTPTTNPRTSYTLSRSRNDCALRITCAGASSFCFCFGIPTSGDLRSSQDGRAMEVYTMPRPEHMGDEKVIGSAHQKPCGVCASSRNEKPTSASLSLQWTRLWYINIGRLARQHVISLAHTTFTLCSALIIRARRVSSSII